MEKSKIYIILATLLALFLGALDTLIMSAAMPTIIADLGGLHLYSWAFSSYMLSRAVSLPIFGKLCDLFENRILYGIAIGIFLLGSVLSGTSTSMTQLIFWRTIQGIGAGGNFALAYIVLSDISPPGKRGKMMSLASFVWGLASVLGPTIGGLIVTYVSWRWIFYINLPLGGFSLAGILIFLQETREKRKAVSLDLLGALTLSVSILSLLGAFLMGGREARWLSPEIMGLVLLFLISSAFFYIAEKRAPEPILPLPFFRIPGFSMGNLCVFCSSFAIFPLSAYIPLFIQGAMGKSPAQLGLAMISLSLGWSLGALLCGQIVERTGNRAAARFGGLCLMGGCGMTLFFTPATSLILCSAAVGLAGTGMGFISISTLLIVQESIDASNLGVATSSHQFTRTLGGTVGIGIAGSFLTAAFMRSMEGIMGRDWREKFPPQLQEKIGGSLEHLFSPEIQEGLSQTVQNALRTAMSQGIQIVFRAAFCAAILCLLFGWLLPKEVRDPKASTPIGKH